MGGIRRHRGTAALVAAVPVGSVGLVLAGTFLGGSAAFALGVALVVGWTVGMVRLAGRMFGCFVAFFAVAVGATATAAVSHARDDVILDLSGVDTTAVVTAAWDHPEGKHPSSEYDVTSVDGAPLGVLVQDLHALAVGDRVTVRYDPGRRAAVHRPQDLSLPTDLAIAAALNAALMGGVGYLGVQATRRRRGALTEASS
ncbi:hypothetical protein BX285_5065 [Streptomyces sp. 1114.5]|uniref:hypothetical protein n=1 Tax=unclassified Streptomyces TaxID=2593676 RepID=UPI000BD91C5C|nr:MULTISPECIES: hypothetical protein [unclassified Streptomyces]RKT11130.1 hypothetical protein BX285_5065 [Streptomyces sp. 1114.5]SOB81538.1 hypothetical protein SAMN06272789_1674 [Streptomyces sp. 1331.2]